MNSLLLVNYRSAVLAREAIRTARKATSSPLEVVVVDNSCDASEAGALRDVADVVIAAETNRGYAGAINLGRRQCSGDALIVTNPDVTFAAGAIDRLAAALRTAAVAGPALYWDEAHRWILPPGDAYTAPSRIDAILASRSAAWQSERDRRRFLARVAFWTSTGTVPVAMLSGAVMAIRTSVFDALDGFDERFALYFEETDFLRRVRQHHENVVYVSDAGCRHLHNQSAAQVAGEAASRYIESERRYLEKWNGPWLAQVLKRMERPLKPSTMTPAEGPVVIDRDGLVVEASPLSSFETAAGYFPEHGERTAVDLPANAWTSPAIYVRTVERSTGKVLATYVRRRT